MESNLCCPAALEQGPTQSVWLPWRKLSPSLSFQVVLNYFLCRGTALCPLPLLCAGDFFSGLCRSCVSQSGSSYMNLYALLCLENAISLNSSATHIALTFCPLVCLHRSPSHGWRGVIQTPLRLPLSPHHPAVG